MKTLKEYAQETLNVNLVINESQTSGIIGIELENKEKLDVESLILGSLYRSKNRMIFRGLIDIYNSTTAKDLDFILIDHNMHDGLRTGCNSEENKIYFSINGTKFEATWLPKRADFVNKHLIINVGNISVYNCKNHVVYFDFDFYDD